MYVPLARLTIAGSTGADFDLVFLLGVDTRLGLDWVFVIRLGVT